jgi:hypothetical protein
MTKKIADIGILAYSKSLRISGIVILIICACFAILSVRIILDLINSRTEDLAGNTVYVVSENIFVSIISLVIYVIFILLALAISNFYSRSVAKKQDFEKGKKRTVSMVEIRGQKSYQYYVAVYDDAQHCTGCGASLDGTGMNFCPKCGRSL